MHSYHVLSFLLFGQIDMALYSTRVGEGSPCEPPKSDFEWRGKHQGTFPALQTANDQKFEPVEQTKRIQTGRLQFRPMTLEKPFWSRSPLTHLKCGIWICKLYEILFFWSLQISSSSLQFLLLSDFTEVLKDGLGLTSSPRATDPGFFNHESTNHQSGGP